MPSPAALEALHYFAVYNVTWRALPERFGNWNSIGKRYRRLSRSGVFELFFDSLAHPSPSALRFHRGSRARLGGRCGAPHAIFDRVGTPLRGQADQALGRSRGGFSTKLHLKTDLDGHFLAFGLTGGGQGDAPRFPVLLNVGPDLDPRAVLGEAAERALRGRNPCRLEDVRDALRAVYAERGKREDGAVATIADLCRLSLFAPDLDPAAFFARSWIVRLTQDLPELVRVSVVTLVTDALDRWLNSLPDAPTDAAGNRALRVLCVIDEAHRVLGTRLPGLSGLVRLSRSKGGAVALISQSPEDFEGEDDEFLAEMGLVASFATNANPRAVRRILGPAANLAALEKGQAWVKQRGEPSARRIVAWR